jgi:hydroxymethylpyrimidine pyrophosphatase-like HAD family hydrolase
MTPADWDNVCLVVFDMDGTLYNQKRESGMLRRIAKG